MNRFGDAILNRWQSFWFRPEPPLALAICRVVLYSNFFLWIAQPDVSLCVPLSKFYWQPIFFFRVLNPHGPPPVDWLVWMQYIWKISLVTSILGLLTRFSTFVACVLGIYLTGLPYNLGKINHETGAACLALIVMAIIPLRTFLVARST